MSDFDLEAAVAAARRVADHAQSDDDGAATRLRIRESLASRGPSKRTTIIAAVIATMFGSTAFAYYAGWRPSWIDRDPPVVAERVEVATVPDVAPARPTRAAAPELVVRAEAAPEPEVTAEAPPKPPVQRAVREERVVAPEPASEPASEPVAPPEPVAASEPSAAPAPAPSAELAAYRVAHEAHFRGGSPTDALAAWDAYLAAHPSGALAPEARYSRALILIKLKRFADAKTALRPFADAPVGSYRQAEAKKLLAALPR